MKQPEEYASELWEARNTGNYCSPVEASLTEQQAYAIQQACTRTASQDVRVVGYKIGATNEETLGILGLDAPFHGPLYSSSYAVNDGHTERLTLPLLMQHKPRVEAEFVVSMKNDVVRGNADITVDDLKKHIDWVAPGIEIVASRFNDTPTHLGYRAIADFGANQYMVVGKPYVNWQELDLNAHPVTLSISDQPDVKGHSGLSLYGNPLEFVCWLLNQPGFEKIGLKAGQIVSCGTCTGAPFLEEGNQVTADYGPLGRLALDIKAENLS